MDQEKIGKFILNLRKKHHLTQAELANKLDITSQAVSKWENGRGIPDIELMKRISEEFSIPINDLLNGEEGIKEEKKKNRKIVIIALIILICSISLIIYFVNLKKDEFQFSSLSSGNTSFNIKGAVAYTNGKKSIYISSLEYIGLEDNNEDYVSIECSLYEKMNSTSKKISGCCDDNNYTYVNNPTTLSELLEHVVFNIDDYESICSILTSNNLYITIKVRDTSDKVITYEIPILLEEDCN